MHAANPKLLKVQWIDQITNDPKKTADFYSNLLGFKQEGHDEGDGYTSYSMNDLDGKGAFGIIEEAVFPDWARGWVAYFEVEDLESYCDKIEDLGGRIISRSHKQCLFRDPAGAPTVIVESGAF